MSWWIKVFSYFELKVFFEIMSQDKNYFKKICEKIMCHFYNIKNRNINNRNCISNFLNLYPRISFFTLDNISYNNEIICHKNINCLDRYLLIGEPNDNFIFSNNVLPSLCNSNIPFTFCFTNDMNEIEFVNSNIYYFEFSIDKNRFREFFFNEKLLIGFVSASFGSNEFNFGDHFSFGIDCLNGVYKYDDQLFELPRPIIAGDTLGLGLEYIEKYNYRIIITLNGERVHFDYSRDLIVNNQVLKIGLNLNISNGISFNFGDKIFKFNIRKLINSSKVLNICNNNFIQFGYNDEFINSERIFNSNYFWKKKSLKQKLAKESIYNLSKKLINLKTT